MRKDFEDALALAKQYGAKTGGIKKELERLEKEIDESEKALFISHTNSYFYAKKWPNQYLEVESKRNGVFMITDERLIQFSVICGANDMKEILYDEIDEVAPSGFFPRTYILIKAKKANFKIYMPRDVMDKVIPMILEDEIRVEPTAE